VLVRLSSLISGVDDVSSLNESISVYKGLEDAFPTLSKCGFIQM
jgi:hypothetical protein